MAEAARDRTPRRRLSPQGAAIQVPPRNASPAASRVPTPQEPRRETVRQILGFVRAMLAGRDAGAAAAQTMLVRIAVLAINILTGILSARLLGPLGKGEQAAIIVWPQMVPICVTLGLPTALLFNVKRNPESQSDLFSAVLVLAAVAGGVAGAIGAILLPHWLGHFEDGAILCSQLLMLSVPYSLIYLVTQGIIEARGKFALQNTLVLASAMFAVIVISVLGLTGKANSITIALAYILTGPPVGVISIIYVVRLTRPRFRNFSGSVATLLRFGVRQYLGDLFGVLTGVVDQFMIAGFLAPRMIGLYVVAASLCRALSLIQQSMVTVLLPKVVGQSVENICESVPRAARVNLAISLAPTLLIGLGGEKLMQLVYGPSFSPGATVIWLLVTDTLVGGAARILSQAVLATGRPGSTTALNAMQFAVSASMCLALISHYQIVGVAAAMLSGSLLRLLATMACYPLVLGARVPRLIPSVSDLAFVYGRVCSLA
jgi:O-antigen/teichoic acid export membrane protein